MASLKDPKAVALLNRLEKLIAVADAAFQPGAPFVYPSELSQLPAIVEQLQEFAGRKKAARIPFWNCVKAVSDRRPKLGLVGTLTAMVDRATLPPHVLPGPIFELLTARDRGMLNDQEKNALLVLEKHLRDRPGRPPQNLKTYRTLLARVCSDEYKELEKAADTGLVPGAVRNLMDYAAYLDVCQQHYRWLARYQEPLEGLYGLLLEFNYDGFYRQINRVLYGFTPKEANQREWHRKATARERTARHRAKSK